MATPGRARPRSGLPGWVLTLAVLATLAALALVGRSLTAEEPTPAPAAQSAATTTTLPGACADALDLADLLAVHVTKLADAANGHVETMEKLKLGLAGRPGGISGTEAFRQGGPQMAVMSEHGPDAEVQAKRYRALRARCPLP
jgi:hypothetical protein